jgi:hypothetical protein
MHFHSGWSGHAEGFGHEGYYVGGGRYRYISHQQDTRVLGHENRTVWNAKPDHPVSPKTATSPSHRHKREASKDGSSADQPRSSQGRIGPRSESSTDGEAKPDAEKSSEEVAVEQDRVPEAKAETRTEVETSSWRSPNQTVWFPKPNHLVSPNSGQKKASRITAPETAPAP